VGGGQTRGVAGSCVAHMWHANMGVAPCYARVYTCEACGWFISIVISYSVDFIWDFPIVIGKPIHFGDSWLDPPVLMPSLYLRQGVPNLGG
jgi:hypothetical protein